MNQTNIHMNNVLTKQLLKKKPLKCWNAVLLKIIEQYNTWILIFFPSLSASNFMRFQLRSIYCFRHRFFGNNAASNKFTLIFEYCVNILCRVSFSSSPKWAYRNLFAQTKTGTCRQSSARYISLFDSMGIVLPVCFVCSNGQ